MKKLLLIIIASIIIIGAYNIYRAEADIYDSGLVIWLRMDNNDISGTDLTDRSSTAFTSTISGATVTLGRLSQAMNFAGVSDYLTIPDDYLNSQNAGSISAWVRLNTGGSVNCPIIGSGGSSNSSAMSYFRLVDGLATGTRLQFMGDDNNRYLYGNTQFSRSVWYHVVVTSDGTNNRLYVNGRQETATFGGTGISDGWWFNDTTDTVMRYRVGIIPRSTGNIAPCNGVIDDVREFDRGLSSNEVGQLYNTGLKQFSSF